MRDARVIGAGLSGLASAWHLVERGFSVTVFDAAPVPGGLIRTHHAQHGLVETGANAFVRDPRVDAWFARLGLDAVSPRRESRRRYVFRNGRPRRWPLTIGESVELGARVARTALRREFGARGDETVAAWGTRVLGRGATRSLLEPAMQGIYAAPADELSAATIFNVRKRGPRVMIAPSDGMGAFTERLCERLVARGVQVICNHAVDAIDPAVPTIIATDASAAARLLLPVAPDAGAALARVRVAPLVTITAFFEPGPLDIHGFGVLFPEGAGVSSLGVLFNADIFDGRSAKRSETWIIGDRRERLTEQPGEDVCAMVLADRQVLCGRTRPPISTHVTKWPRAIPVYDRAIGDLQRHLADLPPNLALAGNYLGAIGVAALLAAAEDAAARLDRHSRAISRPPWPSSERRDTL